MWLNALKAVTRRLHAGESIDLLKKEFGEAIKGAGASEIAEAERAMIQEGVAVQEIQRLCDLHVALFRETLDEEPAPESLPGHPVFTFQMENEVTLRLLEAMANTITSWEAGNTQAIHALKTQAKNLLTLEKHFSRKENLLFPFLEKKGFEGPSTVMWGVDNDIRAEMKALLEALQADPPNQSDIKRLFTALQTDLQEMIYKEEKILFPAALERLSEEEWVAIREQEEEIGYFNVEPQKIWQPEKEPKPKNPKASPDAVNREALQLSTGQLTPKQINLMLTHLPVDVTYVDENDRVRYFSQGKTRIFDRSPAIIGRTVQKCHPPQSVHRVQMILDDFRAGKRHLAEFWIQMGGQFIHIRYYALYDADNAYQGCIEVSQDVTHIRGLEGEKRLLDERPRYND